MQYKIRRDETRVVLIEAGHYKRNVTFHDGSPTVEIVNRGRREAAAPDQVACSLGAARRFLEWQEPEEPWTEAELAWIHYGVARE